jgi:hypothetical protein
MGILHADAPALHGRDTIYAALIFALGRCLAENHNCQRRSEYLSSKCDEKSHPWCQLEIALEHPFPPPGSAADACGAAGHTPAKNKFSAAESHRKLSIMASFNTEQRFKGVGWWTARASRQPTSGWQCGGRKGILPTDLFNNGLRQSLTHCDKRDGGMILGESE